MMLTLFPDFTLALIFSALTWIVSTVGLLLAKPRARQVLTFKGYWLRDAPTSLTCNTCMFCHFVFTCFVYIWKQTATCATYTI